MSQADPGTVAERAYAAIHRSIVGMRGEAEVVGHGRGSALRFTAAAPCPVVVEPEGGEPVEGRLAALLWPFPRGGARPDHALRDIFAGAAVADEPVERRAGGRRVLEFDADLPCLAEADAAGGTVVGRLRAYRWPADEQA